MPNTASSPPDVLADIAAGRLVNLTEAAAILGAGYDTARRRILRDALPTLVLRGRRYVARADLARASLRVP